MKLRFERFEGVSCFSIRGEIVDAQVKLVEVGLETLCKSLEEDLMINLTLAGLTEQSLTHLLALKKKLPSLTKHKVYWVSPIKGLGDFQTISLLASRLPGFKVRQIGERIQLEDDVFTLQSKTMAAEKRIQELGGSQDSSAKIILENKILKEQERILKESIHWQEVRMKGQVKVPSKETDFAQKTAAALGEIKKLSGLEVKL